MIPKGLFTVEEAAACGITRMQLVSLVREGRIDRLERGVYSLSGAGNVPMVEAAILAKRGTDFVVSLESALRVHDFTTATPHALWIAMRRGARRPSVLFPLEVVSVDADAYLDGIEEHVIAGCPVRVTSTAKTVADLFKFRSRVGLDLALEALKEGLRRNLFTVDRFMAHARLNRVKNIVLPYVEGYFA